MTYISLIQHLIKVKMPSRHGISLRNVNQISNERDISETSQKHLKWGNFFVTSLRRLEDLSKKMFFCDFFKTAQKHLIKDVFCGTSLRRLEHISEKCLFREISETSQKHLLQVFVIFQKYPNFYFKNGFVFFPQDYWNIW